MKLKSIMASPADWIAGLLFSARRRRRRLATGALFLLLIFPVVLLAAVSYITTYRDLTSHTYDRRQALAFLAATALEQKFDRLTDIGLSLATRVRFRQLVNEGKWDDAIAILQGIPRDFPFIDRLTINDPKGTLMADTPALPDVKGKNFAHRDWYLGVSKKWEPYVSEVYRRTAEPRYNVVAVATPIKSEDGSIAAILVLQVKINTLLEWTKDIEVGPSGFVYVVDKKGTIAAHPKIDLQGEIVDYAGAPAVQKALRGERGVEILSNPIEKEERLTAYAPVPRYGWGVIAQQPTVAAFAARDGSLRRILITYGVILLFVVALAFVILHTLMQRKQAEERLKGSEERFRGMAEAAQDAIITADHEGNITYFNHGAERVFGYMNAEVIGKPLTLLMPETLRDLHRAGLKRFLSTGEARVIGKPVELVGIRKDGGEFPLELSLSSWQTDHGVSFTGILRDVTDRKLAQEALAESEWLFRSLVEGIRDYAIFMLDPKGHVASWNSGAQRIKGYETKEIVGQHISRFYPPEDVERGHPASLLKKAEADGRAQEEGWRVRKDGSRFWAEAIITAIRDDDGRLRGFGKVTRDLTERKQAEEEVKKLNEHLKLHATELEAANKELEAFSYSVSHDLRAPLRALDGFSRILLEKHGAIMPPDAQRYQKIIRDNAHQMGQLIDDLLAFSRLSRQALKKLPVETADIAREALDLLRHEQSNGQVQISVGNLPACQADPALLRQVFVNLISNAIKYTRRRDTARIEIGTLTNGGEPVYFVKDNGVGFEMKYAAKLFGVFQRLHRAEEYEGTGVGLAIVQRIVHRHGGRVWADAEIDKGATFYFTLGGPAA
ncbi:MAG TPA: PAS domain S-box protein [Candidatus Binatia bacterium]